MHSARRQVDGRGNHSVGLASGSTLRLASAGCHRGSAWWRSTGRNRQARPRWRCTPWRRRRRRAASAPSSTPSTRSTVYARKLGVQLDDLLISQPDAGEQALEIADTLVRSGAVDILVIDSVAAPGAARRARGRDGRQPARPAGAADEPGAAQAHRLDQPLQHDGDLHQPDPHEDRRDVRQPGDHERRQCAEIYASVRLDIRRIGAIKERDEVVGNQTRVKVVKNSWRRRSSRSSSTSCTARAFPRAARS